MPDPNTDLRRDIARTIGHNTDRSNAGVCGICGALYRYTTHDRARHIEWHVTVAASLARLEHLECDAIVSALEHLEPDPDDQG